MTQSLLLYLLPFATCLLIIARQHSLMQHILYMCNLKEPPNFTHSCLQLSSITLPFYAFCGRYSNDFSSVVFPLQFHIPLGSCKPAELVTLCLLTPCPWPVRAGWTGCHPRYPCKEWFSPITLPLVEPRGGATLTHIQKAFEWLAVADR